MSIGLFAFLLLAVPVVAALLVGAIVIGLWLRRSSRPHASKPFLGAAISGGVSLLSMLGAVALLITIAAEYRHPEYFDPHPLLPILVIGLLFSALATAFLGALFAVWMFWRLIAARAAPAPAQSAG